MDEHNSWNNQIKTGRLDKRKSVKTAGIPDNDTLNALLEGCQIISYDWRYLYVNDTAAKHGRLPKDKLLGNTMMEIYPGIEKTEMFARLRLCMEKRLSQSLENEFTYQNGDKGWFELRMEPVPEGVFILSIDISKRKQDEERIKYLNFTLLALRNVNQLITREEDCLQLITRSCDLLVKNRGFLCTWILLFDEIRKCTSAVVSGNGKMKSVFHDQLMKGYYPLCVDAILKNNNSFAVCKEIVEQRKQCLPKECFAGGEGFISRLEYGGKIFGVISAYVPSIMVNDLEEQSLFIELAGDIAYALASLEKKQERNNLDSALFQSEKLYRSLFENMMNGFAYCKMIFEKNQPKDFVYLAVNSAFEEQTGLKNVVGKKVSEVIPNIRETDPQLLEIYGRVALTGISEKFEIYVVSLEMWFSVSVYSPEKEYFVAIFDVITERKKAEESLRSSESKYRELAESISDVFFAMDSELRYVYWNVAAERLTGILAKDALGKHIYDIFPDTDVTRNLRNTYTKVIKDKQPQHFITRYPGGENLVHDISAYPSKDGISVFVRDITKQKLEEEELLISRRFHEIAIRQNGINPLITEFVSEIQKLTECEAVGIRLLDDAGNIPYKAYVGFSKKFYETESPLSIKSDHCMCINVVKGTTDPRLSFYTTHGSFYMNGTTRFLATLSEEEKRKTLNVCNAIGYESVALIPVRAGNHIFGLIHLADHRDNMVPLRKIKLLEQITSVLGICVQRALYEDAQRQSEQKYRALFENSADGILVADIETKRFVLSNPAMNKMLGYSGEQLSQMSVKDIHPVDNLNWIIGDFEAQARGEKTQILNVPCLRQDGTIIYADINTAKIDIADKAYNLGFFRDITDRKKAENELRLSYDKVQRNLEETAYTLAHVVEARDPYTAGHQKRVTQLALAIAKKIRLEDHRLEIIRFGSVLHDIGKISVPTEILSKPSKLNEAEFNLIKNHPRTGYDIIKNVDFHPDVAHLILQHHERLNGSGYPGGLSGRDILFESKILAVADVVEAMASHRPYRPSLGIEKALEEITNNRGILYDSKVVDICLELFKENEFVFE